jgi:HSP20 family protein
MEAQLGEEAEMSTVTRWRGGALTPFDWSNVFDWLDLSQFPPFSPMIRVEDFRDGDRYVVRAELPGIDPEKDVRITCKDGMLRLDVERSEEHKDKLRSEFRYGSFYRAIPLPTGAQEDTIKARYSNGILEITVKIAEKPTEAETIPIELGEH